MENQPTQQTFEVSTPGEKTPGVVRIVTETSEQLTRSYERLQWLGFTSMSGGLIVVLSFVFSVLPGVKLEFNSQVLFTIAGFCMLLLSGALFALQNVHSYRLEIRNRDLAIRSLEMKHDEKKAILNEPGDTAAKTYIPPR